MSDIHNFFIFRSLRPDSHLFCHNLVILFKNKQKTVRSYNIIQKGKKSSLHVHLLNKKYTSTKNKIKHLSVFSCQHAFKPSHIPTILFLDNLEHAIDRIGPNNFQLNHFNHFKLTIQFPSRKTVVPVLEMNTNEKKIVTDLSCHFTNLIYFVSNEFQLRRHEFDY